MTTHKFFTSFAVTFIVLMLAGITQASHKELSAAGVMTDLSQPNTLLITESNYACFRNIECVNRKVQSLGLEITFNRRSDSDHYVLSGSSINEKVHAVYNHNGLLVNARLVHINTVLPREINQILASGEYEEWQMVGNEKVVMNFDARTTEYRIIMQKDDETILLYFDRDGNPKNQLFSSRVIH